MQFQWQIKRFGYGLVRDVVVSMVAPESAPITCSVRVHNAHVGPIPPEVTTKS